MMEVYAAALSYCDYQMGRILDAIEEEGQLDNTLVIYIQGDNGASAEGGPKGLLNEMAAFNGVPEDFEQLKHTWTIWAARRRSTIIRSAGRRRWTRRSNGPSRLLRISAARATAWSSPGRAHQGQRRHSHAVPSRHRHRADHPGSGRSAVAVDAQRRAAKASRGRQHGLHL